MESKNKISKEECIYVRNCNLCNSSTSDVILDNITDNVCHAVDYFGSIHECSDCGHAYLNPILNSNTIKYAYNGYYTQDEQSEEKKIDKFFKYRKFYHFVYKKIFNFRGLFIFLLSKTVPLVSFFLYRACKFIPINTSKSKKTLLDIGCGSGEFLLRARECGYIGYGIDFDPTTIEIAKSIGLNVEVNDIANFKSDELFDVAILSHVIEHVENPKEMIQEIYKRLSPGGYFYIATPNFHSAGRKIFKNNWRGIDAPRHMHFFNKKNLKIILKKSGFTNLKQVYDLPQSIGIIKSSIAMDASSKLNFFDYLKYLYLLMKNKFYISDHLEVLVFKCYKPL